MDDSSALLLQRAAVLRRQLKEEKALPRPESIEAIIQDLERTLDASRTEALALSRQRDALIRQNDSLRGQNEALTNQRDAVDRQKEKLERQLKTVERYSTNIQRQVNQVQHLNAALQEKITLMETETRRYQDLFDFAPDPYLITDSSGVILEANRAASGLLNISQRMLKGQSLFAYITPRDQKLFFSLLTREQHIQDVELCIQPNNLPPLDIALNLSAVEDGGSPRMLRWLLRDITERRRAMAALNASERRFRTIFNEANLGILLLDPRGVVARANRAFQDMLGFSEDELVNHPISTFTCNEDLSIARASVALQESRQANVMLENRFRRRDGQYIWASISLSLLRGEAGRPQYLIGMVKDITNEKLSAAELAEMRRRLLESGEVDRLRLAQELHDGPTQDMYGAVFRLTNFSDQTSDPTTLENMRELQEILKNAANQLRDIVGELRPPTIGNLGLERAIRSHAERVQEAHPEMEVKMHLARDGQTLPSHTRLALFRIYQQCMSNVLRHASAGQVVVSFHLNEKDVSLDVWDNGCGFLLPDKWVDLLRAGHYGLAGIAERVEALGGTLKIETRPGSGTLVHVTAPR